jgi:GTP cyclohydrolase II
MSMLGPANQEILLRARADLRLGIPIILAGKENDAIIAPIEVLNQTRLDQLKLIDKNSFILLTARRARTLKCPIYDRSFARISLGKDPKITSVKAISDPSLDLRNPLKGPFEVIRNKTLKLEDEALLLLKSAQLLPAAIISKVDNGENYATQHNLTYLRTELLQKIELNADELVDAISAEIPTARAKKTQFYIFRPGISGEEHYAMEIGTIDREKPILVRMHSACFTGDVLGSLKCDCGPQLHAATKMINEQGGGLLIYLNQEGRGIGLANKIRAYALQDHGFDTVEANHRLGFEDDERDFQLGATILKEMHISNIKLITNNPSKISTMKKYNITVSERIPLKVGQNETNLSYLKTKVRKSGHLM